ncbi:MAG: NAD(P)-binding protein, partial [Pseudomonadota bacterium]|nr:NAD(P)-binding protein [Pseudomonadota bacterium]
MGSENIAIVGAGIGALSAAALLARRGYVVDVFERAGTAGGKLRQTFAGGPGVDAGPTVFTLKPIFENLFEAAGGDFEASLRPEPATVIARHFWDDGAGLDLFADPRASEAAIGDRFGRANAEGFRQFQAAAKRCYDVLQHSYIE